MNNSKQINPAKQVKNNMIWSVIQLVINLGITFVLTSYITENIGVEAYGFCSLANTFISYVNIVSVALNSFASRYVSIDYYAGNFRQAKKYYVSVFLANLLLGIGVLVPVVMILPHLELMISIPNYLTVDVKVLFAITFVNYLVTLLQTVFNIATFLKNRLDLNYKVKVLSTIVNAIVMVLLFGFATPKVYFVAVGTFTATIIVFAFSYKFSKKLLPEISIEFKRENFSFSSVKTLLSKGVWNSVNSLGNTLNSGLDLLVTNQMLSSLAMGQLSVSKKLLAIIATLNSQLSAVFQPKQMEAYATGNYSSLISQLKFSMKTVGFIGEIVIGGFVAIGLSFLELWVPTQDISLIYKITVLCMLGDLVVGSVNPLYYVYTLTGNIKMPSLVTIVNGLFNVLMMLILLNTTNWGLYCVVGTTIFCNFVINFIWTPCYSSYCLKISYKTFYPEILRHLFSTVLIVFMCYMTGNQFGGATSWIQLIVKGILFVVLEGIILFLIDFNKIERRKIVNALVYRR